MPVPQASRGTSSSRYTILGRLASGGMADIYLVLASTEAGVDRYVVLKRVLAERSRDPVFAQMFLDEARLAAQLQHPNIAQVYDVGKLDGAYFFTMEYVHGEDVRGVLNKLSKKREKLPVNLALYVANGTLAALHYAHDRTTPEGKPLNIVHRDVTPSNVMISLDGGVKLLDFGVAKANERATESRSGSIKGKLAYLSPEQVKGQSLDRRSDIYAVGIVMWEMLTGSRLYRRDSDFNTMLAITQEDVPRPSTVRPDLSPEVERIVMTALEKDPANRYPSAAAMLEDIEAVATAERHLMSATAMGRFMKEYFGSKVEPWHNLEIPDTEPIGPVTITSESLAGLDALDNLNTQLARAPDLQVQQQSDTATPALGMPVVAPSAPAAPRRRWPVIVAVALVAVGAGAVIAVTGHKGPAVEAQSTTASEPTAPSTPPPAEPAVAAPPAAAPSSPSNDTPATAPPQPTAPSEPPTIASAVAMKEWATAVRLCAVDAQKTDLVSCGVAACNLGREDQARLYHQRGSKADKAAIQRACDAKDIALVVASPAKPAPKPPKKPRASDPCKDPAYVEANPLKCQ